MAIETLASLIAGGIPDPEHREDLANRTREAIMGLFGSRYRSDTKYAHRTAFMAGNDAVSFAGLVHEESPSSGVYGGMSLIWFPHGGGDDSTPASLLTFVCGTRGLPPDEQILGRPGHARHLQALRRHLHQAIGVRMWVKHDPTNLTEPFPRVMRDRFAAYRQVFDRYGQYIYAAVEVPQDSERARTLVAACLDFYAWERGWTPLKRAADESNALKLSLRANLFPKVTAEDLHALLRERRFLILQGPPGTGKTRLALELLERAFAGQGTAVQFHPAVTYETFVAGISPDVAQQSLRFDIKGGWLVQAIEAARGSDFLLVIDEINLRRHDSVGWM